MRRASAGVNGAARAPSQDEAERPVEADPHKMAAPPAVAHYLARSAEALDAAFGEGYAAEHPELLAAMIQACAIERAVNAGRLSSLELRDALISLKPRLF